MDSSMDPLLQFKPSEKLTEFITNRIQINDSVPAGIRRYKSSVVEKNEENVFLCLADIKWLQDLFMGSNDRNSSETSNSFHDLILGCDIKLPQPKVEPRNQELEARIQRLKAEQAAREYRAMTKNVDSARVHEPEETIAYQLKQLNKQLIAVAQFVISVLAGFAFGFLGIELMIGNLDFGFRLLLGVMSALVIALAEIYFLAKKLNEDLPPDTTSTEHVNHTFKPHQE